MILLTEKQKEKMITLKKGVLEIDNQKYFYKISPKQVDGVELVIEDLADIVGINCAHYERVMVNKTPFVLSKDIAGDKSFKTAKDILKDQGTVESLYDIWYFFEDKYKQDIKKIMFEVIKIYLFDILVLESDRYMGNWGILFDGDRVDKIYILDNEYSFDDGYPAVLDSHFGFEVLPNKANSASLANMKNLENFLNTSSSEFVKLFKQMYNILTPETIKSCIEDVEDEERDKDALYHFNYDLVDRYAKNYDNIGMLLSDRGLR